MRLLITIAGLAAEHGGPTLSALRTAEHAARLGADVAIAFGAGSGTEHIAAPVQPFPIHAARLPAPLRFPAHVRALKRTLAAFAPDVVYDFGVWRPQNVASFVSARRRGTPWVATPRGMLEPWPLADKKWRKQAAWGLYQGPLLRRAAALVATSTGERDNLRRLLPGTPLWLVPNGVDLPATLPVRTGAGPRQALFLSRLHPKKQPELLIREWARLRPAGWRLVIAGPGADDYRRNLRQLIRSEAADAGIELRDAAYGDDKEKLLRESRLFVLPTQSENFGIVIAEALAHGLPVITTTGTPWQRIAQENCGWWIEPTAPALAAALRTACALGDAELDAMGARGRRLARDYSWSETARVLLAHCAELLA
ncbi:MAG TPA: glycosyltransferase [Candidatus Binatia bacterium]|nr:glycosyltransferase [Candidatus Binatia bacterium]